MLLGLFGDPATNNPLEGEPLLWARVGWPDPVRLWPMINADGGFDCTSTCGPLTGDGMTARQTHRTEREPVVTSRVGSSGPEAEAMPHLARARLRARLPAIALGGAVAVAGALRLAPGPPISAKFFGAYVGTAEVEELPSGENGRATWTS